MPRPSRFGVEETVSFRSRLHWFVLGVAGREDDFGTFRSGVVFTSGVAPSRWPAAARAIGKHLFHLCTYSTTDEARINRVRGVFVGLGIPMDDASHNSGYTTLCTP
jgi:hypothetical protein